MIVALCVKWVLEGARADHVCSTICFCACLELDQFCYDRSVDICYESSQFGR